MQELYYTDARDLSPFYEQALELLTPERREKTLRLRRYPDRLCSLAAGLLLRKYLGVTGPVPLAPSGKPELPGGLPFSLSHGGFLALLAVSDRTVGVDAEPLARGIDPAFYRRVLTPEEAEWLRAEPGRQFSWLWTRKESVMKACGLGLTLSPSGFSVLGSSVTLGEDVYTLHSSVISGHAAATAALRPEPFAQHAVSVQALLGSR